MRRRELLTLVGGAVAFPRLAARAQKALPVIGYLNSNSLATTAPLVAAFRKGLGDAGYAEGQNLAIEFRWAEGHYDRLPELAADLAARKVDVIVATTGVPSVRAAKAATASIPIVFDAGADPVALGLVASLARPGGNVTGIAFMTSGLTPKRLEMLSELVPEAKVIGLLVNPKNAQTEGIVRDANEAVRAIGVELQILNAGTDAEIDAAFAALTQSHAGGLIAGSDPFFNSRRERLIALAARGGLPTIYQYREFATEGGLISYGPNIAAVYRRVGIYAGRILKGEKPADLPVQRPATFELVINLKTAKALGLTVPQVLLAQADEVIE
ncbi:MAG TPA: ABC transporter substrate-binding protein [Stellaceae bacterium]|nr:ABC transporter substrate-binding protein [Stellaceae bacterium]